MNHKKMVLFGAGKIGRSFIAQLFSSGGYEVIFIDVYPLVIDELNRRRKYAVVIKGTTEETIVVENVRGVLASSEETVIKEIVDADLLATAVGQKGLSAVLKLIAKGIVRRFETRGEMPLDIIIAENLRNASVFFEQELKKQLSADFPLNRLVGLVETSIGKMVPIMSREDMERDPLLVFAEPYNTLILDKSAFVNPIPAIPGLAPKENMKAWVDRKLFIHNLGHAAVAYIGNQYNPMFKYVYEALDVALIEKEVRATMAQSAAALLKKYPKEFTHDDLQEHIDDLLIRFKNKALGDTIFRVGCDLFRKLGPDDRLVGAIQLALETDMPYDRILFTLMKGTQFRAKDEEGAMLSDDKKFIAMYASNIQKVLIHVCGFHEKEDECIIGEAEMMDASFIIKQ